MLENPQRHSHTGLLIHIHDRHTHTEACVSTLTLPYMHGHTHIHMPLHLQTHHLDALVFICTRGIHKYTQSDISGQSPNRTCTPRHSETLTLIHIQSDMYTQRQMYTTYIYLARHSTGLLAQRNTPSLRLRIQHAHLLTHTDMQSHTHSLVHTPSYPDTHTVSHHHVTC